MFAPKFHPAMRFVQPIRKSLDFRTAFNILGPLANPAGVKAQVMGVSDAELLDRIAESLKMLGAQRAFVVHGQGMDEISLLGKTRIVELRDGLDHGPSSWTRATTGLRTRPSTSWAAATPSPTPP